MPRGANSKYRMFDYTCGTSGGLLLSGTIPETTNLPVRYTYNANKPARYYTTGRVIAIQNPPTT
jgi:hypothetical protein